MEAPRIIKLSRPITVIDQTFTELRVREPLGADLLAAGDPTDRLGFLARVGARCANISPAAIDTMPARDVLALTSVIGDFFGDTPEASSLTSTSKPPAGGATSLGSSSG